MLCDRVLYRKTSIQNSFVQCTMTESSLHSSIYNILINFYKLKSKTYKQLMYMHIK